MRADIQLTLFDVQPHARRLAPVIGWHGYHKRPRDMTGRAAAPPGGPPDGTHDSATPDVSPAQCDTSSLSYAAGWRDGFKAGVGVARQEMPDTIEAHRLLAVLTRLADRYLADLLEPDSKEVNHG